MLFLIGAITGFFSTFLVILVIIGLAAQTIKKHPEKLTTYLMHRILSSSSHQPPNSTPSIFN